MSDPPDTPAERVSRFREHTNTNSSIRPPPDELWKDLGIDGLLDRFHYENESTPAVRREGHPRVIMERGVHSLGGGGVAAAGERGFMEGRKIATPRKKGAASAAAAAAKRKGSDAAATVATAEGTFGRFSRVFANVFSGVLGKRKATSDADHHDAAPAPPIDPQQELLDERKRAAEEAYHLAKAQGLLPAPKVFVRPGMANRAWSADMPENLSLHDRAATDRALDTSRAQGTPSSKPRPPLTPRTPGSVAKSPSKADLNKQKRLSKRVSSLEVKLASAKKELASVLGNDCFPAVPSLPAQYTLSAVEGTRDPASPPFSDDAPMLSPTLPHGETATAKADSAPLPAKLTKKRKTTRSKPVDADADVDVDADPDFHPTILSDSDADPPQPHRSRSLKRVKSETSKRLKRTSSRLSRRRSQGSMKDADEEEEVVVVVKPGGAVPPVPLLPAGMKGRKVPVEGDDGYGGLGHEIF